jgi:hypothetical protein
MHLGPDTILIVLAVALQPGLDTAAIEAAVQRVHDGIERAVGPSTKPRLIVVEPRAPRAQATDVAAA